jgi:hypothetical protein
VEIEKKQPSTKGPAQMFTGDVWFDVIAAGKPPSQLRVNVVRFSPGAHTAWHRHANGQTLHVTEGIGLVQSRGGEIIEIHPGDTIYTPPEPSRSSSGPDNLPNPVRRRFTMAWTSDELAKVGKATELQVASYRSDGTLRPYVTIWAVRAVAAGTGRIRAGGVERDVDFIEADAGAHSGIDAAYHAKYDSYGPAIVGSVVGAEGAAATLRLQPRD